MIGYYAHHQGAGHLHRAAAVAAHVGSQMTLLSTAGRIEGIENVHLAHDDDPPVAGDVTAAGALHWVPLRHSGLRERSSQIVRWVNERGCSVLVSDVSVEVLLLARLLSIPSVALALRGARLDRAHALGYDVASRILAPWPRETQGPWPGRWLAKTVWVGAVSRFEGRTPVPGSCGRAGRCVVLMLGRGGDSFTEAVLEEAAAVPDVHWHLLAGTASAAGGTSCHGSLTPIGVRRAESAAGTVEALGWIPDPWPVLCRADVVVAAAGDAAIADTAAARRPLIAIPQARPYGEQHDHAEVLVRHRLAISEPSWPDRRRWPLLLDQAAALGGARWQGYLDGHGSGRMAAAILELAGAVPAVVRTG